MDTKANLKEQFGPVKMSKRIIFPHYDILDFQIIHVINKYVYITFSDISDT